MQRTHEVQVVAPGDEVEGPDVELEEGQATLKEEADAL